MFMLLYILAAVVLTQVLKQVSTLTITEHIYLIYTNVAPSEDIKKLREIRKRIVQVRTARSNTSSKDEFAKWAKLDREHTSLKQQLDSLSAKVSVSRQRIQSVVRVVRWCLTSGLRWYIQWRYRKEPVLWLPPQVLPSAVEWFLALPFAPRGSVSVATWVLVCSTSIAFIERGATAAIAGIRYTLGAGRSSPQPTKAKAT